MESKNPRLICSSELEETLSIMRESLGADSALLRTINEGMVGNLGKLYRPTLTILTAKAIGEVSEATLRYAAASELLHNATLLHDDVVDSADLRRGKPTANSLYGSTAAVLVGDFWLVTSLSNILRTGENAPRVLGLFCDTLAALSEGEIYEIEQAYNCDTPEEMYLRIINEKTSSLFRAACLSGAISAGATPEQEEIILRYADALGMAFQIRDDIFDYKGDPGIGKPVGIDLLEGKVTLPLLGALRECSPEEREEIRAKVAVITDHPGYRDEIYAFAARRGGLDYAESRLREYVAEAEAAAMELSPSEARDALVTLARSNLDRNL